MPLSRSLAAVALALLTLSGPLRAEDAGAYLAARVAGAQHDYRAAAGWFARALLADPGNLALQEGAIASQLGAGNFDAAVAVARRMRGPEQPPQLANVAILGDKARAGDFAGIIADLDAGQTLGKLLDSLARAWAELGAGRMSVATTQFDSLAAQQGFSDIAFYHKALALASAGDFEGADAILSGRASGPVRLTRRGLLAHVEILSQLEKNAEALALLDRVVPDDPDPGIVALRQRLQAGEVLPYTVARNAADGMAESFLTLAIALNGEADDGYTLLYSRIATALRPDLTDATLLTGALLENLAQNDLAVETYASVPASNPSFFAAEIGRARALESAGRADEAVDALRRLTESHPELISVRIVLGDALGRQDDWPGAVAAYDAAILRAGVPRAEQWSLFFSRGVAHERNKQWDLAEADFRMALKLNPEQPQVLNYLGYSMIDMNRNLEEALSMIERAVAQEPGKGYIVDSLAWGLFRLGRYADAVAPMERASLLEPVDPVVTDHLGDVYWAVGRKMEARFQWRRALSFDPAEAEATRIREKLRIGLDAVLAAEGAPSLAEVAARAPAQQAGSAPVPGTLDAN